MRSRICSTVRIVLSAAMLASLAVPLAAQTPQANDTATAVRELTAEIRTLRAAIERTSDHQLQSQVLGLYLNLQQNRVSQATARLDGARRELEGLTNRDRELAQSAAAGDLALTQETDPAKRREIEQGQRAMKDEAERVAVQLQQVRNREAEAYQAEQAEEARWTDLISRLEQLLKK
jgi:outer membrane murein-binding lipoprotein Lpp